MATIFSTGFAHGCYFEISNLSDGQVMAKVKTPDKIVETVITDFQVARNWVDRQIMTVDRRRTDETL
jgi:hypothetical protein